MQCMLSPCADSNPTSTIRTYYGRRQTWSPRALFESHGKALETLALGHSLEFLTAFGSCAEYPCLTRTVM